MFIVPRFAHEVYVLSPNEISKDEHQNYVSVFDSLKNSSNVRALVIIGILSLFCFGVALFLKSTKPLKRLGSLIDRSTIIAPDIIRVAFGLSLLISAKHKAIFGPEIPLSSIGNEHFLTIALVVIGAALTLGLLTRVFAWAAIVLYCYLFFARGWYALTYINYFGEAVAVALLPVQSFSLDRLANKFRGVKPPKFKHERFSMPATRIFFGLSLLYAAINIKFATTSLSLDVVNHYDLTRYFHFDPLFVVLGAGLVECSIALLYITGLLRRLNSLLFLGFIITSLLFFKEAVWPHYMLIATAVGIFLHRADDLSLDARLFSTKK